MVAIYDPFQENVYFLQELYSKLLLKSFNFLLDTSSIWTIH